MKIQFYLYNPKEDLENIHVRLADSKRYDIKVKTPIRVYSDCFKNGQFKIPKIASKQKIEDCLKKQKELNDLQAFLFSELQERTAIKTNEAKQIINSFCFGRKIEENGQNIVDLYAQCVVQRKLAKSTEKKVNVLKNLMLQFQDQNNLVLTTANFNESTVKNILYLAESSNERGTNTAVTYYKSMRTFCRWLYENEYVRQNPYKNIEMPAERYGTPFYLTVDERDQLQNAKLPKNLSVQRDIFIFQCLVGCRVADLLQLTKNNINGDFVEYIADKTLANPKILKIPLNATAKKLIEKYHDPNRDTLFPFISAQKYNEAIHEAARIAGLNRQIQKYNSRTNKKEFAPLWQVISSHCARRTFIGILYKKTKDVNVIASMSGHVENSRAFTRYRAIDDDDKRELIDLL